MATIMQATQTIDLNRKHYAYTVFNTSKNNPHYNIIKKCVDFDKYVTHKIKINNNNNSCEFTFLRLVYSQSQMDQWINNSPTISNKSEIDRIVEGADYETIVGKSLSSTVPEILKLINESTSISIDNKIIERDKEYIKKIVNSLIDTDPILATGILVSPRNYFSIENYDKYFHYFVDGMKALQTKIVDDKYAEKFNIEKNILFQISKLFKSIIKTDYLFLHTNVLIDMLNFIVDTGLVTNIAVPVQFPYTIEQTPTEIKITGCEYVNLDNETSQNQNAIMYESCFVNPYELVEPLQYINLKLLSERKQAIELKLKNTERELFIFADKASSSRDYDDSMYQQMFSWGQLQNDRNVYNLSNRYHIKYDLMAKILTPQQKNKYALSVVNFVKDFNINGLLPVHKYSYGAALIKDMLQGLFNNMHKPLDLIINNLISDDESRSSMIIRLHSALSNDELISAEILNYLTDDEIMDTDTFNLINSSVSIDNKFNAKWFVDHKRVLTESLKKRYKLTDSVNDEQLYAFYLFTHCAEFSDRTFVSSVTEEISKSKHNSALNDIIDGFFKTKSSNVLVLLDELKSTLMKNLFINVYVLKASQYLFICQMSDEMSKSSELDVVMKHCIKLMDTKNIHYNTYVSLLDIAFKSTNSFRDKIISLLKANTTSKVFDKKNINNDAKIALYADLLRALSKSFITVDEQTKIANIYSLNGWKIVLPFYIDDLSGVMKAISLVPECNQAISVFYTEKYLQEH